MDSFADPRTSVAFSAWIMLLLLKIQESIQVPMLPDVEEVSEDGLSAIVRNLDESSSNASDLVCSTLHNFRLFTDFSFFDDELRYWVKPISTTWFSRFLVEQYDNTRWISMFRMTKPAVFALYDLLRPHVEKANTKYRLAIHVLIRVCCTLFKLTHGANFTVCSELFEIGRSTVSTVLRGVVHAINETLRHEILWPNGERLREIQGKFQSLCGLPGVVGAIDGMHVHISKPEYLPADYYYLKSGSYTMNCQAVVDSDKRFIDLYLGMPGSTNDSRMLRRSSLYSLASHGQLVEAGHSVDGFTPYFIGDLGYPLLPWLMVPRKTQGQLTVAETLFNKKLRRGRCVVENAFDILKQTFRELLNKSELSLTFLPDVVLSCAILHNVLLGQSHADVEELLEILRTEGLDGCVDDDEGRSADGPAMYDDGVAQEEASAKRTTIGIHLTMQRRPQ